MKETNKLYINYEELTIIQVGWEIDWKKILTASSPSMAPSQLATAQGRAKTQLSALLWLHDIRTTQANKWKWVLSKLKLFGILFAFYYDAKKI